MESGNRARNRSCGCSKKDFLPEKSFESWSSYMQALSETLARLKDRAMSRSIEEVELTEVKGRSGHEMKKTLNWWDLIWFGTGAVIGAGIFVLTGQEARDVAGPSVVLSYVVSGISVLLSIFCYTEFAVEIPVAGGSFAYLRVELGDFVAFIAAGNIILEYVISGAAVARSWTSYFATLLNHRPNNFRIHIHSLPEDYSHLDPLAVFISFAVCITTVLSTKATSRFNSIASIIHLVIILFIIIAGLIHANPKNMVEDFAPCGPKGIFAASAVLFFAYAGFDAVATMAEETRNPGRDITLGLVGSMGLTTLFNCVLAVTLCMMVPYSKIDHDAPFFVAFSSVGMDWAKYVVAFGAFKGMTTVLLVSAVGQATYLTHIARAHMVSPWFAAVHPSTGTPVNATVAMLLATVVTGFFTELTVLANLLSISTLFIFMLVAVALLVRRYYATNTTTAFNRNKLLFYLISILGSSAGAAVYWAFDHGGWIGYKVTVPIWFLAMLYLWMFVPQAKAPKLWGVPLVPWLPSASIVVNAFLLASIDPHSYMRFGIWTGGLLVYYLLFGLHASYDTTKEVDAARKVLAAVMALEEGVALLVLVPESQNQE